MQIVPGHHNFQASTTAMTLCTLLSTDLRSQFYKTPPIRELIPALWSQGSRKIMDNQVRLASRRQALEASEIARNVAISSLVTTSMSTPSQNLGRPNKDDDIHREARAMKRQQFPCKIITSSIKTATPNSPRQGDSLFGF